MARGVFCVILAVLPSIVMCSPVHMMRNNENDAADEISSFDEGDLVADNKAYMEKSSGNVKISLSDNARLWPGGKIPYFLFDREDEPNTFDLVMDAINSMNRVFDGCVQLNLEDDPEDDYINIILGDSLSSQLGHQRNGAQQVTITREEEQPQFGLDSGSIQHELMHSLGFGHEHNREDRDDYVIVLWDNLINGNKEPYFKKYGNPGNFSYGDLLDYDFNSIMHATKKIESLAVNTYYPVMIRKDSDDSLGQRAHFTDLDIERVKRTYSCDICTGTNNGKIFRYPGDCTHYYMCDDGKPTVMPCPEGLHINTEKQYCDYPSQAGCSELSDLWS